MNKRGIVKYLAATVVAAVGVIVILSLRGVFADSLTGAELARHLSDAFTIPGVILIMLFVMSWISTTGFFDILTYAVTYAARSMIPGMRISRDERYADYKERKNAERLTGYSFLLVVGLVFLAVGVIFAIIFYN